MEKQRSYQQIQRASFVWNTLGAGLAAGQASIFLIFVAHIFGQELAGIVSIAYAIATVFSTLCRYGVRNFQVTDVREEFSFEVYCKARWIVFGVTILLFLVYLLYVVQIKGYDTQKVVIVSEIVALKLIDSVECVFVGRMQQFGRLDIGAKILTIRYFLTTANMCVLVVLGMSLETAVLLSLIFSVGIDIFLFVWNREYLCLNGKTSGISGNISNLLRRCFPLCVGTTISVYVGNIPKYMIDGNMSDEYQAIFGYLMLPVFVIALMNQFIYLPFVKSFGDMWAKKQTDSFKKSILKQCRVIFVLAIIALAGGLTIGLRLLSLLYNVDLTVYSIEFTLLLLGGGLYALASYLTVPLTAVRSQWTIAAGNSAACVFALISGSFFVGNFGMIGVTWQYILTNLSLVLIFGFTLLKRLNGQS